MSDPSLLLFTAVNSKYHQFVLPFIYFAAQFNHNLKFEIIFTDDIPIEIKNGVEYLKNIFQLRIFYYVKLIQILYRKNYVFLKHLLLFQIILIF